MNQSSPRQKETLTEANRLITSGLRQAAIDLLLEHLESDPQSAPVLNALGRVYLLDKQPEKAVSYLRRSLDAANAEKGAHKLPENGYRSDEFSDLDLAFIVDEAGHCDATVYDFEEAVAARQANPEPLPVQDVFPESLPDNQHAQSAASATPITTDSEQQNLNEQENYSQLIPEEVDTNDETIGRLEFEKVEEAVEVVQPADVALETLPTESHQATTLNDASPLSLFYEFLDKEEPGLPEQEQEGCGEESLWESDDDFDTDFLDPVEPAGSQSDPEDQEDYEDEEDDELTWDSLDDLDDLDDLDELDELAQRDDGEADRFVDSVSRELRARQVAAEVLARTDWDPDQLPLLQSIFVESGWSACRVAIEQLINIGVSPEELVLARQIRWYWAENEKYWMSFHWMKSNSPYEQTTDAYKHMSWQECFRILSCFPALPDVEEIYLLIEETYDIWYHSNRIRKAFKAFFKFLKYRTGTTLRSLAGDIPYIFHEFPDWEWGEELPCYLNSISPQRQMLSELGIELDQWCRAFDDSEKKFGIDG